MATDRPQQRRAPDAAILSLGTIELRDRIARGIYTAEEVTAAALDAVRRREPEVQAWAWLDEDHALTQARRLDALRASGRPIGPLHGLPVGLKDIIDTKGVNTENGTPLDAGRVPAADATIVSRLKAAGAVILGKTVTTELAFLHPGKTRNPVDPSHTPGGSSQGSAAAVSAGMVPLAVGTQTGGSVIRPAAYCGVIGYKPSFGMVPRTGILPQSPTLDTVGVFATGVEAAALLVEAMCGHDPLDAATEPAAPPRLFDTAISAPPVTPTFALLGTLPGATLHPDMDAAFAELSGALGERAFPVDLPPMFSGAAAERERINFAEMARTYYRYDRDGRDRLSPVLLAAIDRGKSIPARDYLAALDWPGVLNAALDEIFERADAILAPATEGPAPAGLDSTGSAICNGLWTLCGVPVVTLPVFQSGEGLPMGLQVIGRRGDDARLLRTARWLWNDLTRPENGEPDA